MRNWPLRAKLTAWSALVSGVALLICGIGAMLFIQSEQIESLDDQLRNEAHTFFGEIARRKVAIEWSSRKEIEGILPLTRTHRFIEVIGPDGKTLYRTKRPRGSALPRIGPGRHTIRVDQEPARLGCYVDHGITLYLAAGLTEIDADTTRAIVVFLIVLPLLVAIIAFGGWWVARKALAPVHLLTVAAEQINAQRLSNRLPKPQVRDEIGHLTDVLNEMFDRLDLGFRQAARFSADASHELKTPLSVLHAGMEDLLNSPSLPPSEQAALASLLEQTHRLTSITESLLLLSRADAGRLQLDFAPGCIGEIIEGCVDDAMIMAEAHGITIESSLPENLPATIDSRRVAQIVLNLLQNAVKYNREGGIVRINAARLGEQVTITIANTGAGIEGTDVPRLFERFFRGSLYPDTPGQGLGLSLSRELARAHFGDLELVQTDAEWTVFRARVLAPVPVVGERAIS